MNHLSTTNAAAQHSVNQLGIYKLSENPLCCPLILHCSEAGTDLLLKALICGLLSAEILMFEVVSKPLYLQTEKQTASMMIQEIVWSTN